MFDLILLLVFIILIIYAKKKHQQVDWKIKFTISALVICIITALLSFLPPIHEFFRDNELLGMIIYSIIYIPIWMLWIVVLLSKIPVLKEIIKTDTYNQSAISVGVLGLITPLLLLLLTLGDKSGWADLPAIVAFIFLAPCSLLAFISIPVIYSYKKYPESFRMIAKIVLVGLFVSIISGIIIFNLNNTNYSKQIKPDEKTELEHVLKDLNDMNNKGNHKQNNNGYSTYTLNF